MKKAAYFFSIAAGLLALAAGVGTLLPSAHEHTRRATYHVSSQTIWDAITDLGAYPTWRSEIAQVEKVPSASGKLAWREHGRLGSMAMEMVESKAPEWAMIHVFVSTLPLSSTWYISLKSSSDGTCEVTVTEKGMIENPVLRLTSRFFYSHERAIEEYLRALGRKLGETTEPH